MNFQFSKFLLYFSVDHSKGKLSFTSKRGSGYVMYSLRSNRPICAVTHSEKFLLDFLCFFFFCF